MPAPPASALPVLALDTATESVVAGLQTDHATFTVQVPGGALASAALLPQLRGLLARAGLVCADVQASAFGRGPGAFTGLRTACAVAQGLGYGLGRPLLPLDSLLIVAEDARVQAAADEGFEIGVAMDARMNEIYGARYRWAGGAWLVLQAPALMSLPSFNAIWAVQGAPAIAGSALAAFGDHLVLPSSPLRFAQQQDRAAALLRLAVRAAQAGEAVDAADALPLYLRDKVAFTTAEREAAKARAESTS